MKEFVITQVGFFIDGKEQDVGSVHCFESMPSILVGKAEEVIRDKELEVATPRRVRPPKE
jgi:hypothetical protein